MSKHSQKQLNKKINKHRKNSFNFRVYWKKLDIISKILIIYFLVLFIFLIYAYLK